MGDAMGGTGSIYRVSGMQKCLDMFKIKKLYPHQEAIIHSLLSAGGPPEDAVSLPENAVRCGLFMYPTGSGKSVCFLLPSQLFDGLTVVVYPLRALIHDQKRKLDELHVKAAVLVGGQTAAERKRVFSQLGDGHCKLVLTTPETLKSRTVLPKLEKHTVSHFVIDEAHVFSSWGREFRPIYRELGRVRGILQPEFTSSFTATATGEIINDLKTSLFNRDDVLIRRGNADRPNLRYYRRYCVSKLHTLGALLEGRAGACIVFCPTRLDTEKLAAFYDGKLQPSFFYHAGLPAGVKRETEESFMKSDSAVLFATCAYGMGVDKKNIRTVIHYSMPRSLEDYAQEAGRAGRDGKPSDAVVLFSRRDLEACGCRFPGGLKERAVYEYLTLDSGCLRAFLNEYLGSSTPSCNGCDVCGGFDIWNDFLERGLLSFFKVNNRLLSLRDAIKVLKGYLPPRVVSRGLNKTAGFGMLGDVESGAIEEAILNLIAAGRIRSPSRGWFKNRLCLSRRGGGVRNRWGQCS